MNLNILKNYIKISNKQIKKFNIFFENVIFFNKKINLTAIKNEEEFLYKHFIDSIIYGTVSFLNNQFNKILDLGTGAGFPGIPLAILFPKKKFILLDSLKKRVEFLNYIILKLSLKNVKTIHERAENLGKNLNFRESFDIVLSRAVAYMPILLEYTLPLTKIDGYTAITKELPINKELNESSNAIKVLGGHFFDIKKYILPKYKNKRAIIFIKKIIKTPEKYPRNSGIPLKKSL